MQELHQVFCTKARDIVTGQTNAKKQNPATRPLPIPQPRANPRVTQLRFGEA